MSASRIGRGSSDETRKGRTMEYTLHAAGMTVSYLDTAPEGPDNKQVLLFFHGWGGSKETFSPVVGALEDRYRLIAPDLPGFGKTGEPDRPWSTGDYADFIEDFIGQLGLSDQPLSYCGHSHGGRMLIKWASRPGTRAKRLILIDAAGLRPKRSPAWYGKVYAYKAAKILLRIPVLGRILTPLAKKKMTEAGSTDYRQASPLMRDTMKLLLREDLGHCLPDIKAPTLLFWGEQDGETPPDQGRRMEREIPNAGLVLLSPAGHYSFLDQLPVFLQALTYFMEH